MSKKPSLTALAQKAREDRKHAEGTERGDALAEAFAGGAADRIEAAKARKKPKEIPAWQEGKRVITAWIEMEQFKALNELHVDQQRSIRVLIVEAIDDLLVKHDKLPPHMLGRRSQDD